MIWAVVLFLMVVIFLFCCCFWLFVFSMSVVNRFFSMISLSVVFTQAEIKES